MLQSKPSRIPSDKRRRQLTKFTATQGFVVLAMSSAPTWRRCDSEATRNVSASIRARLLSLAQSRGEDYQRVLGRYAIERFLYRLERSEYRDNFALKGATLFTLWTGQTHRPTKDLDLLGRGSSAIDEVEETIREICEIQEEDDIV